MSMHAPVVFGETSGLRTGVEGMLSTDGAVVLERLSELDTMTRKAGWSTSFGAEMEFMLPEDPLAPRSRTETDLDSLYFEVASEINRQCGAKSMNIMQWPKGAIVIPSFHPQPVMLNYDDDNRIVANSDDQEEGIIEIRTAPAEGIEAVERYWHTVQAIGTVAARWGRMGMILGTHLNATVYRNDKRFVYFASYEGRDVLAASQQNLNSLNPLQMDAGLEEGISVLEAFPETKDASTAIHKKRLEFRHPDVGVIDPRIDILSVLDGVRQAAAGTVSRTALARTHACSELWINMRGMPDIAGVLVETMLWDQKSHRFVMPAYVTRIARCEESERDFNEFTAILTGNPYRDGLADNGYAVRRFVHDLHIRNGRMRLRRESPYSVFDQGIKNANFGFDDTHFRVLPNIVYDSPEAHLERRKNIAKSSIVRRVLGPALPTLTPSAESIAIRNDLVKNHMVVAGNE